MRVFPHFGASAEYPHRGITMYQMKVGGNFPGLLFAVGTALIFLVAIPALWYFVGAALVMGIAVAGVLHVIHRVYPDETAQLRIQI